ncbi:MAG TPA: SBBP repeat-containing protein, partial [Pyrinomonadaceae bacterium]
TDGGANWAQTSTGLMNRRVFALASRAGGPATLLAGTAVGADPFVMKLNAAGSAPEYLRLLGGSEFDDARSIALGPNGSAYVTGQTGSPDFPVLNARQTTLGGGLASDAYVVKLDSAGNTVYATFHGGSNSDSGAGIAVGPDGSAYVTGTTTSNDFPVANALKSSLAVNDFQDAFVTKLSPDGQTLTYSTYLGGTNTEAGTSVAVDASGGAYVAGQTTSQDFPLAGLSSPLSGFTDAFVAKLNPAGSALLFSTCFGGTGVNSTDAEQANSIALDGAGGIYVAGSTSSPNIPVTNAVRGTYGGGRTDAFVAKFGPGIDVSVTMTDSPDPVVFSTDLTYAIKVKNNGDLNATGVRLTDALPSGASFVSAASDRGACSGTGTVVCDIGTLAGGEEANVTVKVKPPATRTINNTATATLNETDANPSNNSAAAETTVDFADLSVTKSALVGSVAPGSKAVFLLTVTNRSGAAAGNVTISDALPAGLTFSACDAPHGVCGGAGNSRNVTFASLGVGATETATIFATVAQSAANGSVVNNTATVASALPDPNTSDNSATASLTVAAPNFPARSNGKIVYTTYEAPTTRLNVVNPDGTGLAPFTQGQSYERKASWSPDGSKLAYKTSTRFGGEPFTESIVVVNADGTGAKVVATDANVDARPTWSPAGDFIAYLAWAGGTNFSVNVVGPDGSGRGRLFGDMEFVNGIDWSPDGSRFAYTRQGALWVTDVDGTNRRQLTTPRQTSDGLTNDSAPDWSPDGTSILFTRSTVNGRDAYTINPDGAGLSRLINVTQMGAASWAPDGLRVVYTIGSDLYVADIDGARLPSRVAGAALDPAWQPLANANPTPTPTPVPTFSISGRVAKPDGSAGSAIVRLSGTRT